MQLAKTPYAGIDSVSNHSRIWFEFIKKKKDSTLEVKDNALITATNWIYNIDARLSLAQILPDLNRLQKKHHKETMHSNGTVYEDYFAYANILENELNFIPFTSSKLSAKPYTIPTDSVQNIFLEFRPNLIKINKKEAHLTEWTLKLSSLLAANKNKYRIFLQFAPNLSFEHYLNYKTLVMSAKTSEIEIYPKELIQ